MVEERVTDGVRIAELLASEVTGRTDGPLADLAVTDADPAVEPTTDGALAYAIERAVPEDADASRATLAEVYVHPDRARVEVLPAGDDAVAADDAREDTTDDETADAATQDPVAAAVAAVAAADRDDLRARPKAVRPPRTLVFVESGAAVKAAVDVLAAAADATAGAAG